MSLSVGELRAIVSNPQQSHYRRRDALRDLLRLSDPEATPAGLALAYELLADPEKYLRREAVKVLADRIEQGEAVDLAALAGLVGDDDEETRRAVVRGLAASKDPSIRGALETLAQDRSYFIKRDAERALAAMGEGDTAPTAGERPPWESEGRTDPGARGPLRKSEPLKPSPRLEPLPPGRSLPPRRPMPSVERSREQPIDAPSLPELEPLPDLKALPELTPVPGIDPVSEVPPPPKPPTKRRPRRRSKAHPAPSAPPKPKPPEKLRIGHDGPKQSKAAERILDTVRQRAKVGASGAGAILDRVKDRAGIRRPSKTPSKDKLRIEKARDEIARHKSKPVEVAAGRCAKCGWALRPNQKFCVFCGAAAKPTDAPARRAPQAKPSRGRRASSHTVGVADDHGSSGHTVGVADGHGSRTIQRSVQRHVEIRSRKQNKKSGFGGAGCLAIAVVVLLVGAGFVTSMIDTFNDLDYQTERAQLAPGSLVTLEMPNGHFISGILVRQRSESYDLWIEEEQRTNSYVIDDASKVRDHGSSGATSNDLQRYRSQDRKRSR